MIFPKHTSSSRLFWITLLLCHLALLCFLYFKFGFNVLQEGDKYLSDANNLTRGNYSRAFEYQRFSSFYIIYLSLFLFLKLPVLTIFLSTYLLSLTAYILFYKLLKELTSQAVAKVWLSLMMLSPMLQYWQFNLFSETFFIAVSLLFIYIVLKRNVKKRIFKTLPLALALIFSRPGGILIVLSLFALYAFRYQLLSKKVILSATVLSGLLLLYMVIFKMPVHYEGVCKEVAGGAVYAGFPTLQISDLPEGNYTLWNCYQNIIAQNGYSALGTLFAKKGLSFFVITRPYYTLFHNFINGFHYLFYIFSIAGIFLILKSKNRERPFFLILLSIVFLNALMVAFTFNEWSERYTVQVFPYIFILAAFTINILLQKLKNRFAV